MNPQYLDKNYGAILIVWDRLFGTLAEEREPPVFGTTKPIRSFNPAWAQVQTWFEIAEKGRALRGLRERARLWVAPPSYDPLGRAAPDEAELRSRPKHATDVPSALKAYALAQFAPLIAATFFMLLWQYSAPKAPLLAAALLVFWALVRADVAPRAAKMVTTTVPIVMATAEGRPTKAAEGFARGKGVTVDSLVSEEDETGSYVYAVIEEKGRSTGEVLPDLLARLAAGRLDAAHQKTILDLRMQLFEQPAVIAQAGQRVAQCVMAQLILKRALFCDVDGDDFVSRKVAMIVIYTAPA